MDNRVTFYKRTYLWVNNLMHHDKVHLEVKVVHYCMDIGHRQSYDWYGVSWGDSNDSFPLKIYFAGSSRIPSYPTK